MGQESFRESRGLEHCPLYGDEAGWYCLNIQKHVHNYPHAGVRISQSSTTPLDSWFIKDTARKERMVELNKTIHWQPESTGTGRFGNWLENLNDWNLSRSRFWGTPLPIWRDENRGEKCIGSVEELYNEIEKLSQLVSWRKTLERGWLRGR